MKIKVYCDTTLVVFGTNAAEAATGYTADAKEMQAKDPDFIFVADPYGLPHLQSNAAYKDFGAVKNGKVYTIDNTLFALQSSRVLEVIQKIVVALYPDAFDESAGESSEQTASGLVVSVASK